MKRLFYLLPALAICLSSMGCQMEKNPDLKCTAVVVIVVLITSLFLVLAKYSNILREEISNTDEYAQNAQAIQQKKGWAFVDKTAPYSLTKVQFGLWTVIISSVYIYLSLCKGDCAAGSINQTALILMGVFAGSTVASSIIDKNEINDSRPRYQNAPSQGFFVDILSDATGVSISRFQNFVWTIIAMIVYIYKVSLVTSGCDLPELSDTILALTGISSATFVALKTKENNPQGISPPSISASNQIPPNPSAS